MALNPVTSVSIEEEGRVEWQSGVTAGRWGAHPGHRLSNAAAALEGLSGGGVPTLIMSPPPLPQGARLLGNRVTHTVSKHLLTNY